MGTYRTFFADDSWYYRWLYKLVWLVVIPLLRFYMRITIDGRDNIPKHGPFILAPVHRSYVDTPIAASVTRRRMRFMGKDSMWKYHRPGLLFSALGAFPVARGTPDRESLQRALQALEMGEGLVLFPEGERKQGPDVFPLLDGAVFLAVKAGVPIVPVGIGGSERVMPKSARFVYPRKVHVEIGRPLMPPRPENGRRVPRRAYQELAAALQADMQALFDVAMAAVPWDYAELATPVAPASAADTDKIDDLSA